VADNFQPNGWPTLRRAAATMTSSSTFHARAFAISAAAVVV